MTKNIKKLTLKHNTSFCKHNQKYNMVKPHNAIIQNNIQEENYIIKVNYNLKSWIV